LYFSDLPTTCEHIPSNTAGLQGRKRHQKAVANESFAQELCKPPLPTTLGGPARNLNINEIVYIKDWLMLLMLQFRRVINVAQFFGTRRREILEDDFIGNSPQTTARVMHDQGKTAWQRSMRTKPALALASTKNIQKSLINVS
jgi:hypothetical protein